MSDTLIQDYIASRLVLPNRITVPLKKNMNIAQLRFPIPCVRVFWFCFFFSEDVNLPECAFAAMQMHANLECCVPAHPFLISCFSLDCRLSVGNISGIQKQILGSS